MSSGFTETSVKIPCCICGTLIVPNPQNMCISCLQERVAIGEDVPSESSLTYCGTCGRYQISPTQWANYELESPELLQLCLKTVPALKHYHLVDARFVWREPHSKRIEIRVLLEKEAFDDIMTRKTIQIVFVVRTVQCPDCREMATKREHWKAIVQLRQHISHKRTVFWLEQQILGRNAHEGVIAIERKVDGLDFQFSDKPSAERFVGILKGLIMLSANSSAKVVSEDLQSAVKDTRFTYSLKCPPVSRQDLILLPKHLVSLTGNQTKLALCHAIGKKMALVDPIRGSVVKLDAKTFWTKPFEPLLTHQRLRRFAVLSKDEIGPGLAPKFTLADFELTDEDTYEDRVIVRSHLGKLINEGDICLAYDLRDAVFPDEVSDQIGKIDFSKIVIVAKARPEKKPKKRPRRQWRLKKLAPLYPDDEVAFDDFMDELEDDEKLRAGIVAFKEDTDEVVSIPDA